MVTPTQNLLLLKEHGETTQASSLLMLTKGCGADRAHFFQSQPPPKATTDIKNCLKADFQRLQSTTEHDGRILAAMAEILGNKKRLKLFGSNEVDIRNAVCSPIMSMVCDCYSYSLKLEESIREHLEGDELEDEKAADEAVLVDLKAIWNTDTDTAAATEEGRQEEGR